MRHLKTALLALLLATVHATSLRAQSIQALRDSMAAGNLNSQVDLACEYIYGDSVAQDIEEAFRLISDAAHKGNRYGQLWLGICYDDGIGVQADAIEAFAWYQRAAEQGNILAQNRVGYAYEFGRGVSPDIMRAVSYYQQAADAGYPKALMNLAVCYKHGRGVERSLPQSFDLMRRAAEQDEGARLLLAAYHFNGWGTERDKEAALRIMSQLKEGEEYKQVAERYAGIIEKGDTMHTYEFQFRFIPSLLWQYEQGEADWATLTDIMEWRLALGMQFISHYDWNWEQVSAYVHHETDSVDIVVYRMPYPAESPLCLFTAAVVDKRSGHSCQYFTLEKTIPFLNKKKKKKQAERQEQKDAWMFCGVSPKMFHLNYGLFTPEPTEENFVAAIRKHIEKSQQNP